MDAREIKVVNTEIQHTKIVEVVNFIVENSFSKADGRYHKYLQDYYTALIVLATFTDYEINAENVDDLYNEVMSIYNSNFWANEIVPKIGMYYDLINEYTDSEIEELTKPFASMDALINGTKKLVDSISEIVEAVDPEKLQGFDFSKLAEALNAIQLPSNDDGNSTDNIVPINGDNKE